MHNNGYYWVDKFTSISKIFSCTHIIVKEKKELVMFHFDTTMYITV